MIVMTNTGPAEAIIILLVMLIVIPLILRSVMGTVFSSIEQVTTPIEINWEAANDEEVRKWLPEYRIKAIKAYRALTGVGLAEAKYVIDYLIANPGDYGDGKKKKKSGMMSDDGIRELVKQGRIDEAITTYQTFTGLSYDEAVESIEQIEQEVELARPVSYDNADLDQHHFSGQNPIDY